MDPNQQQLLLTGGGKKETTYLDDVFHIQTHIGTSATRQINNGIDLASKGGLIWAKARGQGWNHTLFDTVRPNGRTQYVSSNDANGEKNYSGNGIISFNSNGYTLGDDQGWSGLNNSSYGSYSQTTFRKSKGFFDVVTYTGTGSTLNVAHSLGCVPGFIMIKCTNTDGYNWQVYHTELGNTRSLKLDSTDAAITGNYFNDTSPTSTHFTVGATGNVNYNGFTYVAYVFAGGKSTTAKGVDLDGSGDYLSLAANSDLELDGDFTIEGWVYVDVNGWGGVRQTFFANSIGWATNHAGISLMNSGNSDEQNCITVWSDQTRVATSSPVTVTPSDGWTHIAVTRSGSSVRIFKNGAQAGSTVSYSDTFHFGTGATWIGAITMSTGATPEVLDGKISNLRVVKGQALYTTNFNVPSDPLTTTTQNALATNASVKLLCCNQATTTGSTVTPGTITANGDPTITTTDSIFVDTAANIFGEEGDQNIIKTGIYKGNSSATGPEINLGWEPQWFMIKRVESADEWPMYDSMRGIVTDGADARLYANQAAPESQSLDYFNLTPTGFKITRGSGEVNTSSSNYIYIAIRRPDPLVAKPVEAGTDAFAMDVGNNSATIPGADSNFPVDFGMIKLFASTQGWYTGSRLTGNQTLFTDATAAQSTNNLLVWDSNKGFWKGIQPTYQAWMWKRHAGFDVVTYKGDGTNMNGGHAISHNLTKNPEMIWIKTRSGGSYSGVTHWTMSHKGLNGGTTPWRYQMQINLTNAESATNNFGNTDPTSTHFYVGDPGNGRSNDNNSNYLAMLFASVEGFSKVGSYTGSGSNQTIELGFTPRFFMCKARTQSQATFWAVFDSLRGISTGTTPRLALNNTAGPDNGTYVETTSSGITLNTGYYYQNEVGYNYIYYAHA